LAQPKGSKPDPTLGWANLVSRKLKTVAVIGTHNSIMMHEPHIVDLVLTINCYPGQLHDRLAPQNSPTEKDPLANPRIMSLN
jgi:hypothetical protein